MQEVVLKEIPFTEKVGDNPTESAPNITEDSLFIHNGELIGFYINKVSDKVFNLLNIANKELLSDRVPKSIMRRASGVEQYSTIIGSIPPSRLRKHTLQSSVHRDKKARKFVRAMLALNIEAEKIIKKYAPEIYHRQVKIIANAIPDQFRIGKMFTSSINNANISADYHQDNANLKNTVNCIFYKKRKARGGDLSVPKYGATIASTDGSMLVYPAWRDMHGVTPIEADQDGYRNSFVFYPLRRTI